MLQTLGLTLGGEANESQQARDAAHELLDSLPETEEPVAAPAPQTKRGRKGQDRPTPARTSPSQPIARAAIGRGSWWPFWLALVVGLALTAAAWFGWLQT